MLGCNLSIDNSDVLFLNVYLPYQYHDNYEPFMNYMGKINVVIEETPTDKIVVIGDFNYNIGSKYYDEVSVCCDEFNV